MHSFITQEIRVKNRKDVKLNALIYVSYYFRQNKLNDTEEKIDIK